MVLRTKNAPRIIPKVINIANTISIISTFFINNIIISLIKHTVNNFLFGGRDGFAPVTAPAVTLI